MMVVRLLRRLEIAYLIAYVIRISVQYVVNYLYQHLSISTEILRLMSRYVVILVLER